MKSLHMAAPNNCVQATPDCALLSIVAQVSGAPDAFRWATLETHMRYSVLIGAIAFLAFGCAGTRPTAGRQQLVRPVVLAVNLRLENEADLKPIERALASAGIPFEHTGAVSCNEAPLEVNVQDFEQARRVATDTIIRDSLTARLYKSPSHLSLLEVWEKGRLIREEPHRLYNPSADMPDYLIDSTGKAAPK